MAPGQSVFIAVFAVVTKVDEKDGLDLAVLAEVIVNIANLLMLGSEDQVNQNQKS